MPVWKKWLDDLASMGLKDLFEIFIRADAESVEGKGFWSISPGSIF
jgi:hypothetical protein